MTPLVLFFREKKYGKTMQISITLSKDKIKELLKKADMDKKNKTLPPKIKELLKISAY